MAAWIPSPNFYEGRRRPLTFIVFHSTEGQETKGAARAVAAGWFAKRASKVSAHIVADNLEVVECVKPGDTAWHCGNANADGYGVEIVGKAAQSGADWSDPYSTAAIRNACRWIRDLTALDGIPVRWLTDDQVRRREPGHVTHEQVARILGGSTHTDPGAGFPRDLVMTELGGKGEPGVAARTWESLATLKQGDQGAGVEALQRFLNRYDWRPPLPVLKPDGGYGPKTVAVVRGAQEQCGVTGPDAVGSPVGPRTKKAFWARGYRG